MITIIDIGSNNVKAMVYDGQKLTSVKRKKLQLINKIVDQKLSDSGLQELSITLEEFKCNSKKTYVYATSAIRDAKNQKEIIAYIKKHNDLDIDILSGFDEARYTFNGVIKHTKYKKAAIIDIGGGSTEMIIYEEKKVLFMTSYNLGCVRLNGMPIKNEFKYIKNIMKNDFPYKKSNVILGRGGTITRGIKLIKKVYNVKGEVDVRYFYKFVKKYTYNKKAALKDIRTYAPEREDSLISGFVILIEISKAINAKKVVAINYGLKDGYLEMIKEKENANI